MLEFVIATTGVQIHYMPPRTDFASYYLAGGMARDRVSPYDAAELVRRGHALGFTYEQYPYLYPPPFALAMQPLAGLPFVRARQVWMIAATAALIAALVVTVFLVLRLARELRLASAVVPWAVLAAFAPAALNSSSVHSDIRLGSVGIWLWLLLASTALGLLSRRRLVAGAALGVATLVRLTPSAFLPWLLARGAKREAIVWAVVVAAGILVALVAWGPGILLDWWTLGMRPAFHRETGWAVNQSLDAFIVRVFDPSALVEAPAVVDLAPRLVSVTLSLIIVVVTVRVLGWRVRPRALWPLEMGTALLALLAVTRITWVHTLAAMLFVWPVLMLVIIRAAELGSPWARRAGLAACAGFFLSSAHLPVIWDTRLFHGPLIWLTGAHLVGVLVLWATACLVLRSRELERTLGASAAL